MITFFSSVAGGLLINGLWEAFKPKEPTLIDRIFSIMPQIMLVIIIIGCVLMYKGILKYYVRKKRTFLFPILFSLLYFILFVFLSNIFYQLVIIALAIDIALTYYYLHTSIQINKGHKSFKSILVVK